MAKWVPICSLKWWQLGTIDLAIRAARSFQEFQFSFIKHVSKETGWKAQGRQVDGSFPNELPLDAFKTGSEFKTINMNFPGPVQIPWTPFWYECLEFTEFDYDAQIAYFDLSGWFGSPPGSLSPTPFYLTQFEGNSTGGKLDPELPANAWGASFASVPLTISNPSRYVKLPDGVRALRVQAMTNPSSAMELADEFGTQYQIQNVTKFYQSTNWALWKYPAPLYRILDQNAAGATFKWKPEYLTTAFQPDPSYVHLVIRTDAPSTDWFQQNLNFDQYMVAVYNPYLVTLAIEGLVL